MLSMGARVIFATKSSVQKCVAFRGVEVMKKIFAIQRQCALCSILLVCRVEHVLMRSRGFRAAPFCQTTDRMIQIRAVFIHQTKQ